MVQSFDEFCNYSEIWNTTLLLESSWPHFTWCFMNTLLVWVPCGWLWLTMPFYLYYLLVKADDLSPLPLGCLNLSKTFFSLVLFFVELVDLIHAASQEEEHKKEPTAVYVAGAIKAASFLLTALLTQVERKKGFITSGILFIFWLLITLAGIIPFYTYVIQKLYNDDLFTFTLFYVYYAIVLVQLILHAFAEKVSRRGYYELGKPPSPEISASFVSRISFWWVNKLVFTGYRKTLDEGDMWQLHPRDQGERVIPQLEKAWTKEKERCKKTVYTGTIAYRNGDSTPKKKLDEKTPLLGGASLSGQTDGVVFKGKHVEKKTSEASLFKAMFRTYFGDILKAWGCKFVYDLLQFVSPMLLGALIDFTNEKDLAKDPDAPDTTWKGYIFAASFFIVAFLQSCFFHQNFHFGMTLGMRMRSALIAAVYKKALTMNNEAKKTSTVGEIVNLMSVDCQRVQDITGYLWMLWSAPLQITLAIALLWNTMGPSVLAGLAIMVLLMPINAVIAYKQRQLQVAQMRFKDNRIKTVNEVLNGIKVLKLYAWEPSFQDKILAIRDQELDVLKRTAYLNAFSLFCWSSAPFLVSLATFVTYVLTTEGHYLEAQKAFVALSLFNILRFPMNLLPMLVSYVVMAQVSIGRIGRFLKTGDLDPDNVQHSELPEPVISVKGGTFSWDDELEPALKNINVDVPPGKLVAIVGTVGAGKSSLISAILGEMEKLAGKVNVKGSIAYVPQQAWIQNATVQENILFGKEMEQRKYEKVLEACALGPDLEILTGGDKTEIGEKGINLSGGQKQRVSLARAVYNNADLYLLDDPLSAVDSHVGKHIFNKVVGDKGLLRNKTRILVTHGVHWLPMVDSIIVVLDGVISEVGSYEELMSHNGAFAQFLKTYLTQEMDEDEDPEIEQIRSKILERVDSVTSEGPTSGDDEGALRLRKKKTRQSSESSGGLPRSISRMDTAKGKLEASLKSAAKEEEKLIQEEKSETGQVKWSVYASYAKAIGVVASLVIMVMYLLGVAAGIVSNVWLSQWTSDPFLANTSLSNRTDYQDKNYMYLGVYAGIGVTQAFVILVYALLIAVKMVRASRSLHYAMLANILKAPMSFFDTTPIGRIVNRFSRDIETLDNNLPQTFRMWLNTFFATVSVFVVISYSTPIFLAMIIPLGILYYLVQRFYIPTARQLKRLESTTRSPIYAHFSETVSGVSTIRAYGMSDRFFRESRNLVDTNMTYYFAGIASNRWLGFRLEFLGNFITLFAALFAVVTPDIPGSIVGLSVSYALQVTGALNFLVRGTSDLETNVVSVERIIEYSNTETEADWILPMKRPPHDWPDRGNVQFQEYSTRYREGLDLVLKGISGDIKASEKVGIVGRTGAGKSSLTVALFRLIEAAGGSIIIDNQRISDMGLHDLRSKITILPQDPVLFSGTLRMNIDPVDRYTDEQLWMALEHAHLRKFVTELPEKLQHECGEGGQNLSVGQRQLVCLARTLLRKTKILVLDEATAAVDMETDDLIQKTIRTEFKDCTVITIAHRLNTIMDYDRVIVMDQGLIKEFDSPEELKKDRTTVFYGMARDAGLVS